MMMIFVQQQLDPGEYVVVKKERWTSIVGELMARPDLMRHIGPVHNWTFTVKGDDPDTAKGGERL